MIWADDVFGYGKPHYKKKWWFDLEDIDGSGYYTYPRHG